jgi:hypothetical protein
VAPDEAFMAAGVAICPGVIDDATVARCVGAASLTGSTGRGSCNRRNLLAITLMRLLAESEELMGLVSPILGRGAFPVRGILFDKTPGANWFVGWHQDCAIAVKEKVDNAATRAAGFGPWSVKGGVVHVEPPAAVLENMVTLRLHLDDCGADNGPLRVIPGSHRHGKLSEAEVKRWVCEREAVTCRAQAGDVVVMRPLLLHASSRVDLPGSSDADEGSRPGARRRRVVHLEYAAGDLPGGLEWHER